MSERLRDLVHRLGGSFHGSYVSLPGPGHSRHDRSLAVKEGAEGRLVYYSHAGDSCRDVQAYLGISHATALTSDVRSPQLKALNPERRRKLDFCAHLWGRAQSMNDDIGAWYLSEVRGVPHSSPYLRFLEDCPGSYDGDNIGPAILAFVRNGWGQATGLHATFLKPDGSDKTKRLIFGMVQGGAVQLSPPTALGVIGLCEGVETSLSFAKIHGVPTWAALSAGGIKGFSPPHGIKKIIIGADSDDRGVSLDSARALAERLNRRCDVIIMGAPTGCDWNDVLRSNAS